MAQKKAKITKRGTGWQVDFGTINGKRERKLFRSKAEAVRAVELYQFERENRRIAFSDLTDTQRGDVMEALKLLDDRNTLCGAVQHYLDHAFPDGGRQTVAELIPDYLESKKRAGRRERTLKDAEFRLKPFVVAFGDRYINDVGARDVESWLYGQGWSDTNRDGYRRAAYGLFQFAMKKKHVAENPMKQIERVVTDQGEPHIFSVDEVRAVMRVAAADFPEMVPFFAIGFFAGLRPENELRGLDWKNVNLASGLVTVTGAASKTRKRRHVDISDNLKAWLAPYRHSKGKIHYSRRSFRAIIEAAAVVWKPDVMRHSFASYLLAVNQDAAKTALQLGHGNQDMLFSNYRNITTPAGDVLTADYAARYWAIMPEQESNVIALEVGA